MTEDVVERSPPAAGISLRDLTVRVGGRPLLEGASAEFPAGEVTLIIGASGVGKTVLMKVLTGLIRPGDRPYEVDGSIEIGGRDILRSSRRRGPRRAVPTGIVFQNAALFDELSARDNIVFARDHRPPRHSQPSADAGATLRGDVASGEVPQELTADKLLAEYGVPRDVPVQNLSGGQKQRLAIARTLAYDPPVVIYDEPTAGLDPFNAARVAERIANTGRLHRKTSVVVTHDYGHLAPIAGRIYLFDPDRRALVQLERGELEELAGNLPGAASYEEGPPPERTALTTRLARAVPRFLEATGAAVEKLVLSVLLLLPLWRSVRWGLRYTRHYVGLVASPTAWLYFGASGFIAGFVSTHFVFKFLPHKKYTEPLVSDELLNGLGFALYRIIVPVLLTILVAARCGAAVASDVGNRVYGYQVDAMRSLGASPPRYLLTGILYAFLVGTPLLVGFGFLSARATSLAVYVYNYPEHGADYWDGHFHRDLRVPGEVLYRGSVWLLAKLLACGLGVGAIAYHFGMLRKTSGVDVSRGITSTIIVATLYVLGVHFAFAFLEF